MCHARLKVMTKLCCPPLFCGELKQKMSLWKRLFCGRLFMYTFDYIARNFSLSLSLFSWPSLRDFRVVLVDEEPFQDLDALSEEFV